MTNRFIEMSAELSLPGPVSPGLRTIGNGYGSLSGFSGAQSVWARPFAAADRVLVILIENGGVDLGIPALVDKVLAAIPGSSVIPDSAKASMVSFLKEKIKAATDKLLEDLELSLNRYSAAKPSLFGDVVVLRDGTASYADLKRQLIASSRAGKMIDLIILTHGRGNYISVTGGIDGAKIRAIKAEHGAPLTIRSVYMMNCVGSSLNQPWLDAGAKVSSGSIGNNYLPEPTTYFFWKAWKEGKAFGTAATSAYQQTISLMNAAIRSFVSGLPIPGSSLLASRIDVKDWDFVKQSAPNVQGRSDVTISSDALTFTQSLAEGLATTVVPVADLPRIAATNGHPPVGGPPRRNVSDEGIALLKSWQPFRAQLYADAAGRCAIGHGTVLHDGACDGRPIEQPHTSGITVDKALELLRHDAADVQAVVHSAVSVPLAQHQLDALVSLVSDIGARAFQESTLVRLLNEGHHDRVPAEIRKWTKARRNGQVVELPELAKRRDVEASFYAKAGAAAGSLSFSIDDGLAFGLDVRNAQINRDLSPIQQPSVKLGWAAVFTMMYRWRNYRVAPSIGVPEAVATVGEEWAARFDRGENLDAASAGRFYDAAGLSRLTSFNPTIDEWVKAITTYGPLYVDVGDGTSKEARAIIVTGIFDSGAPEGSRIRYLDPSNAQLVEKPFLEFLRAYEGRADRRWPHLIVYWGPKPGSTTQSLLIGPSHVYESPSLVMSQSQYSMAQNPGVIIAGITVADAAQIGLAAVAIAQAQVAATQGSFTLSYDKAQRLLTTEARAQMPGSQSTKKRYSHRLFYFQIGAINAAKADVIIEWEGNPYGEISTPIIRRDLATSTEWSRSSVNTTITKVDRIPLPNTDPRAWPISYSYEGTYDPYGNGYYEFSGEFEINAFGGLKFTRHQVVSRSMADWAIGGTPQGKVQRGADVIVPVPQIPHEQITYLRTRLP